MKLIARICSLALMAFLIYVCSSSAAYRAASKRTNNEHPQSLLETSDLRHRELLRSIADTITALRQIHTEIDDTDIPPAARRLLGILKHELRDLITNLLSFEETDASTQQLNARLIVDLRLSGVTVKEPECRVVDKDDLDNGYDYGEIYEISVQRPRYCFDLIAVTTTIGVPYGEDTSLYLFKYGEREWKLILADEADNYDSIIGAHATFGFGVSRPDEDGGFFVVTASVNPWPTSNWQRITYRVLRAGPSAYEPRVLLDRNESIWVVDEPPYRLEVGEDEFTLGFHDDKYLELQNEGKEITIDDPKGKRIVRYRIEGDSVIPIK